MSAIFGAGYIGVDIFATVYTDDEVEDHSGTVWADHCKQASAWTPDESKHAHWEDKAKQDSEWSPYNKDEPNTIKCNK